MRHNLPTYAAALCALLCCTSAPRMLHAGEPDRAHMGTFESLRFVENRGQYSLAGDASATRFVASRGGVHAFFLPAEVRLVFTRHEQAQEPASEATARHAALSDADRLRRTTVTQERLTMRLAGANPDARVRGGSAVDARFNFYLASCPRGLTGVPSYTRIVCENVYPHIDLAYSGDGAMMKAAYVVHPGGDPSDIRIVYSGMRALGVTGDGRLRAVTSLGESVEDAPVAFTREEGADGGDAPDASACTVPASFAVSGDTVRFDVGTYDRTRTLVIDPPILWGTYFGGSSSDVGNDIVLDNSGQPVITGLTTSASGIATAGTNKTVYTGPSSDAFVASFTSGGSLMWGTYFGGPLYEGGKSIAVDAAGSIAIAGFTASDTLLATTGAFQTVYGGGAQDAFVAKFASNGTLLWSTYLGGSGYEDGNGIITDQNGDILVTGWTSSTNAIATPGSHQPAMAGVDDAFIVKFSAGGSVVWGTYYGGTGSDWGEALAIDPSNNVVLCGRTTSTSGIATAGTHQSAYGGGPFYGDGYVAKFAPSGMRIWGTYFGGPGDDWASDVAVSPNGDIVITGYTESFMNISTTGASQFVYGGGEDAFVAKFNPSGGRRWATYLGGAGQDRGRGIDVYGDTYVMVTGSTTSTTNIATSGAHQPAFAGGVEGDAFMVEYSSAGGRICGTYLGGPLGDVGNRIATDAMGYMFITGYTISTTGIATPGAWQPAFAGLQDAFLAKFDLCLQPSTYELSTDPVLTGPYCAGDSIYIPYFARGAYNAANVFSAYLSDSTGSFINPRYVGQLASTKTGLIRGLIPLDMPRGTHYRVRVDASDPYVSGTDNGADITIYAKPSVTMTPTLTQYVCPGKSITLHSTASPGAIRQWYRNGIPVPGGTGPDLVVNETAGYQLNVSNADGCTNQAGPVSVVVAPPPARAGLDRTICIGGSTIIGDPLPETLIGYTFSWSPNTGLSAANVAKPTASPSVTTKYLLTLSDTGGCKGYDTVVVTVVPPPLVDAGGALTVCKGSSVLLTANVVASTSGFTAHWEPATGLENPDAISTLCTPDASVRYILHIIDEHQCEGVDTVFVQVLPQPQPFITANGPTQVCDGDSVRLDATPGFGSSYRWNNGDSTRSIVVKVGGLYSVTVQDAKGCKGVSNEIMVTIRKPDPVKVTAAPSLEFCVGDSVVLTAEDGHRAYRWSSGARTRSIVVKASGTFTVQVLDTAGCTVSSLPVTTLMSQRPLPRIFGPGSVCANSVQTYTAPSDSTHGFTWSVTGGTILSGNGTRTIRVRWGVGPAGSVEVIENIPSTGCAGTSRTSVAIGSNFTPAIIPGGPTSFCLGDSVVLNGQSGLRSYRWNTGDTTESIVVRAPGIYSLYAFDPSGCNGTSLPVPVVVHPVPLAAINGLDTVCTGAAHDYSTPAIQGASYRWTLEGGTFTGDSTSAAVSIAWSRSGIGRIAVRVVIDSSGCADSSAIAVHVADSPVATVTAGGPLEFCDGDSVTLSAQYSPGWSYLWSTGERTQSIVVVGSGVFHVEVTGPGGCTSLSDTIAVRVHPRPDASVSGPDVICAGFEHLYTVNLAARDTVTWSVRGGTLLGAPNALVARVRPDGSDTMWVRAHVGNGWCEDLDSMRVLVSPLRRPAVSTTDTTICEGQQVRLSACPAPPRERYLWSTGDTTCAIDVGTAGRYWVQWWYGDGCTAVSDTITVTVVPAAVPVIVGPNEFCEGDSIVLAYTGITGSAAWSTGATTPTIVVKAGGVYTVTVTDPAFCTGVSSPFPVTMHPRPAKPVITRAGRVLTASPASSWQWRLDGADIAGATSRTHTAQAEGVYSVRITDTNGCSNESDTLGVLFNDAATASVALPDLTARPGDIVDVPVLLAASVNLDLAGATAFSGNLVFDASLLAPVPPTAAGSMRGAERVVPFTGVRPLTGDTLTRVRLRAMLGSVQRTPLRIESFDWNGARVTTSTAPGSFTLIVCDEGGVRLFDGSASMQLRQNQPNPFNALTTIEYRTIEQGPVRLSVHDMLGREVALLVDAPLPAGEHRAVFDAGVLPSGAYLCVLRTADMSRSMMMQVLK